MSAHRPDGAVSTPEGCHADRVRGHISVGTLVLADMGPHLSAWTHSGDTNITPERARWLAAALTAWADRRGLA